MSVTSTVLQGTRDFGPEQMVVREEAFGIIRSIFKRHGAVEIGRLLPHESGFTAFKMLIVNMSLL